MDDVTRLHSCTHIIQSLVNFGCVRQAHINRMRYFAAWNNNEAAQRMCSLFRDTRVGSGGHPPAPYCSPRCPSHAVGTSPVYLSVGFFFLFARKNHEGFRARFASSKVSVRCGASIRKLFKITYILRGELRMRAFERVFLFLVLFRSSSLSFSSSLSLFLFF